MTAPTVHATAIVIGETGVLIRGRSGSGKSSLALALVARVRLAGGFAAFVADDRVARHQPPCAAVRAADFGAARALDAGQHRAIADQQHAVPRRTRHPCDASAQLFVPGLAETEFRGRPDRLQQLLLAPADQPDFHVRTSLRARRAH